MRGILRFLSFGQAMLGLRKLKFPNKSIPVFERALKTRRILPRF
jgi:hypothetical protein